ncbi:MAG: hypothetical protein V2J20_10990 [Wenzhouxiangella sp.]|jgi:hypothetical protein|nr:hypothetical protein [Wenzhouxiangella sp.]
MRTVQMICLILALTLSSGVWADQLFFEKTPYGLLFADISVEDRPVRAMIDFGDPHVLQLATSFIETQGITVESTGQKAMYADGTTFDLLEGQVSRVEIGGEMFESLQFGSSPGEIDAVAKQVGTPFQAVVGWGFFGRRRFVLDYAASRFELGLRECPAGQNVSLPRVPSSSYLMLDGSLAGQNVRFLIDTGSPLNALHSGHFDDAATLGKPILIEHLTSQVPGRTLSVTLDDWQRSAAFELRDLSALEPLGVQAILGAPFLSSVQLCHDPADGLIHLLSQSRVD